MLPRFNIILLAFTCFASLHLAAQGDSLPPQSKRVVLCEVKLADGAVYRGYILQTTDSSVVIKSSLGVRVSIPKKSVVSISPVNESATTVHPDSVPVVHVTEKVGIAHAYYITASNSFLFKKNEIYGSSDFFILNHLNYSFSKNFSLGVSASLIGAPAAIKAKANFALSHKLYAGVEGAFGGMLYLSPNTYAGGIVGKLTYGDEHEHFTLLGGYTDAEYYVTRSRSFGGRRHRSVSSHYESYTTGMIGAAAALPVSAKTMFSAEAFAFPAIGVYTASAGFRTLAKQNISWVFALQGLGSVSANINHIFLLPLVGFSYKFN